MPKFLYFAAGNDLPNFHEEMKITKKNYENFCRKVEPSFLSMLEKIESAIRNDASKICTYARLKKSVENQNDEMRNEFSDPQSFDAYTKKSKDVETMTQERIELRGKRDEMVKKIEVLRCEWEDKKSDMTKIQEKVTLAYKNLKLGNKLYEKKLNIVLAPGSSDSYTLMFPSKNKQPLYIKFKLVDGNIQLKNIKIHNYNTEAVMKLAQSTADFQGLLSVMNSIGKLTIK